MAAPIKRLVIEVEFDRISSPYKNKQHVDPYKIKFQALRQSLILNLQQFIPIEVTQKDPPYYYILASKKNNDTLYIDTKKNKVVQFPRKDSFEVTIDHFLIFSRLQTGKWPNISSITEWTFRVAEKILDLQIQKETIPLLGLKNSLLLQRNSQNQNEHNTEQSPEDKSVQTISQTSRLPSINKRSELPMLQTSHELFPKRSMYRAKYGSIRKDSDLPYGIELSQERYDDKRYSLAKPGNNISRIHPKIQQSFNQTLKVSNRYQPNAQYFHWNFETKKRNVSMDRGGTRLNPGNPKQALYKRQNVQLQPLPILHVSGSQKSQQPKQKVCDSPLKVQFKLSESLLNSNIGDYNISNNRIEKHSGENQWSPIVSDCPLPVKGVFFVAISVIKSQENRIEVGLAPVSFCPKSGEQSDGVLLFNFSNGMIKDCKHDTEQVATKWRQGGQKVDAGKPFIMRVVVDMNNQIIDWFADEDAVASAKIPNIFLAGCRIFINLMHDGDTLNLNEQSAGIEEKSTDKAGAQETKQLTGNGENQPKVSIDSRVMAGKIIKNYNSNLDKSIIDQFEHSATFQGHIRKQRFSKYAIKKNILLERMQQIIYQGNKQQQENKSAEIRVKQQRSSVFNKNNCMFWDANYGTKDQFQLHQCEVSQTNFSKKFEELTTRSTFKPETTIEVNSCISVTKLEEKLEEKIQHSNSHSNSLPLSSATKEKEQEHNSTSNKQNQQPNKEEKHPNEIIEEKHIPMENIQPVQAGLTGSSNKIDLIISPIKSCQWSAFYQDGAFKLEEIKTD